ncbi:LacI family DNA-binding transcriptional regulator [Salmonella enterica]|nr:LacI family DNA-binding transcriptional regulator [Salmonella enterica]MDJ7048146.1 LacI family DNA-binding transcriptional regulator [Salmonella enterica]MDJ7338789.1 LacI family DNA-binding transcriptional regulator [Salmonella enterica]
MKTIKSKSVTLYDVARYSGVSYQTVSRVINKASNVSEKTRNKVEATMTELNYVPNRGAQLLAGKLSHTFGLATSDLSLHAPSKTVAAVKKRADDFQFNVVISMVDVADRETCSMAVKHLLSHRVDGLIVNIPLEDADAMFIQQICGDVPVLFLDVSPDLKVDHIIFNPDQGTRLGVEHLLNLGHRNIVLLSGPLSSVSARLRHECWTKHLSAYDLKPAEVLYGDWSSFSGYREVSRMITGGCKPDAILAANDQMALGALRALSESGYSVPDDVSVIGYDDTEDSACFTPPLTTIKHDFNKLGSSCVEHLLALIKGESRDSVLLPVTLVKRKTTMASDPNSPSPEVLADKLLCLARQVARLK